ncbi:MAG: GNAT family N-acetyltransferase [Anaerolineae bacterium]
MGLDETPKVLAGEDVLRPGGLADGATLDRLLDGSRWAHWADGPQETQGFLRGGDSLLWWQGESLRGALLFSRYRLPVIEVALLAVRDRGDLAGLYANLLPRVEEHLHILGASWVSLNDPPVWLAPGLSANGYQIKDRVISYYQEGLHLSGTGNDHIQVRQARIADTPAVTALDDTAFESFWRLNAEYIRRLMAAPYALLAESAAGQEVGYLAAERWHDQGFITRLAVLPAFQGRGIGHRLLAEAFARMRADGLAGANLNTQQDNARSRRLYERLGFRLTGEVHEVWAHELGGTPPAA